MASNCYGYALRLTLTVCPGTRNGEDSVVDRWSNGLDEHPFIDRQKEVLLTACIKDGLRKEDSAGKKIAVFVNQYEECIDYHFYRLDDSGFWSGQDSPGGPIETGIQDPVEYNKSLVGRTLHTGVLKGQMYAGMLYLPSGDDMEEGWD